MNTKLSLLIVSLFSLLVLVGCGDKGLTGSAVGEVSTLTIQTQYENGSAFPGASVFVNENFKGLTREYGVDIGTRTVVLSDDVNTIRIEAAEYASYSTRISSTREGEQHLTVVMQGRKMQYTILVEDAQGPITDAEVNLYQQDKLLQTGYSDSQGKVKFGKIGEGDYIFKVTAPEYEEREVPVTVVYDSENEVVTKVLLSNLPQLDVRVYSGEITLPEAEIKVYTVEGYNRPNPVPVTTAYTNSEGNAVVQGVEYEKEYVLIVRREGFNAVTLRRMVTAGDHTLEVHMNVEI